MKYAALLFGVAFAVMTFPFSSANAQNPSSEPADPLLSVLAQLEQEIRNPFQLENFMVNTQEMLVGGERERIQKTANEFPQTGYGIEFATEGRWKDKLTMEITLTAFGLFRGGPAERAGIQIDDRIMELNGTPTACKPMVQNPDPKAQQDEEVERFLQGRPDQYREASDQCVGDADALLKNAPDPAHIVLRRGEETLTFEVVRASYGQEIYDATREALALLAKYETEFGALRARLDETRKDPKKFRALKNDVFAFFRRVATGPDPSEKLHSYWIRRTSNK